MLIKAVLFDFDGTLTVPGSLDYTAIKAAIGCPTEKTILEYIEGIPCDVERTEALRILNKFEIDAAAWSRPNAGAEELLEFLLSNKLRLGIISRNTLLSIQRTLENFERIQVRDFDVILSRDDPTKPKPSPEGIQEAARRWDLPADQILVVGDFVFDIEAGRKAGAHTVFLTNREPFPTLEHPPDFTIHELSELKEIVRYACPLSLGKLSNVLLGEFLRELSINDVSLIIGPNVGEDIAAVRIEDEEVLVLKSDPITFAADQIGHYTVLIGANDVATSGATPRWLLATLLFPPETNASRVLQVMLELRNASLESGLTLCGGHTEITDAINRPVAVGHVIGTVSRNGLINKLNMKEGDRVLLTKGVAIEGTSIVAREFSGKLSKLGLSRTELERCQHFLSDPGISILKEAQIASSSAGVTALHDLTEGGLATAVEELSVAGKHRIRVYLDAIPVLPETRKVCELLGIHPLGLIGSGSLLICCAEEFSEALATLIRTAGIDVQCIGEVLESGFGIEAVDQENRPLKWPHFEVDEITRLFG